jgi:hypothetical protein
LSVLLVVAVTIAGCGRAAADTGRPSHATSPSSAKPSWEADTVSGNIGDALVVPGDNGGTARVTVRDPTFRARCGSKVPSNGSYLVVTVDVQVLAGPVTLTRPLMAAHQSKLFVNYGTLLTECGGTNLPEASDAATGWRATGLLVFDAPPDTSVVELQARWGPSPSARWSLS